VGDYHGNFDHATFMKWVRNRFLPWAAAAHPALLEGAPGAAAAKVCLMLDNAPYHVGSTENLVAGADLRFNPLTVTKRKLFVGLRLAGCASLDVPHAFTEEGGAGARTIVVTVEINDANMNKKGKAGSFPGAEEFKVAAVAFLSSPRALGARERHRARAPRGPERQRVRAVERAQLPRSHGH
jgi:hypothetical protein